jgi:hypothetical protein
MKRSPQFCDGGIEIIVEIDKDVFRPEPPAQFFPRDNLSCTFQQLDEYLELLVAKPDSSTLSEQLARRHIDFVFLKANYPASGAHLLHFGSMAGICRLDRYLDQKPCHRALTSGI